MDRNYNKEKLLLAIKEVTKEEYQDSKDTPIPTYFIYIPQSHARALDPDISIVVGIRGAGKSFWWQTLTNQTIRSELIKTNKEELSEISNVDVYRGFGSGPDDSYPSKEIINNLCKNFEPKFVWRAVIAYNLRLQSVVQQSKKQQNKWEIITNWVFNNIENYERSIAAKDDELTKAGRKALILFDALDRLADEWKDIRPIAKQLFMTALEMRSYKSIRLKLFVRPDMLGDDTILAFPDASKLKARTLDLTWNRSDLYSLFFQRLANSTNYGNDFRDITKNNFHIEWQRIDSWSLLKNYRNDEETLKKLFHSITGPFMAKGESGNKRGTPYTWLVNHLMDGRDQVSPRSFLAALYKAAETVVEDTAWNYPLNPKAIQAGVTKASSIRKDEIVLEDYPWVKYLMEPLRVNRLIVPCDKKEIIVIWNSNNTVENFRKKIENSQDSVKLPPIDIEEGTIGILKDLIDLGIFQSLPNRKIQMPDVYRIAFGIGRKGGVKPLR